MFSLRKNFLETKNLWLIFKDPVHLPQGCRDTTEISLFLTTKSPKVPVTHLVELRKMES